MHHSRLFPLLLLLLGLLPAAHAFTLEEALGSAAARPAAVTARLELLNASNELLRVDGDPLALRLDLVQAQQAVQLKAIELTAAHYEALLEISEAYVGALQARNQLELAEHGLALAESGLRIAEIRVENGSATQLELQEARVSAADAARGATAARSGLALAVSNLEGMTGKELTAAELESVPDSFLIALPDLAAVLQHAREAPQLLQAVQGLELARLGVSMLDPSYASAAQIESAETQLATTEELVTEARRGLELQTRNLYLQAETSAAAVAIEQDSADNARERLRFQQERLDSGLIAQIQFDQERLTRLQAELALQQARHDYLTGVLRLAAGTLVPLSGPPVLTPDLPALPGSGSSE